ncbi:indolepyruvate ferredoxin oxidoreductase family protein [Streptomyces sp. NPDC004629]|uniref:indolepyruvate ferredoxin oxidoreductase family protein n=1 Tax=Streptomyces sp. NPDC004629 TaxID=3364705 RepID=UPI0036AF77AC
MSQAVSRGADGKPLVEPERVRLTGVQALARLPLDIMRLERSEGRRTAGFISGYEGSPLGGYDLELGRQNALLGEYNIVFQPGVNEELAATAVQGSQLAAASHDRTVDGVIGMWYGKSPGLDRASDALRHSNMMGVPENGGALVFVGDDAAAKSSTVPGASERLLADLGIPTLYPADPQQVLDLGMHAAAMSRASGLWIALKISTDVADGSATVDVSPGRLRLVGPRRAVAHEVTAKMLQPTLGILEASRDGERRQAALAYAARNELDVITGHGANDAIGIVAAGPTFLHVREALHKLGLTEAELARHGVRLLQLAMIDPVEPGIVTEFAEGLTEIIVVEDKRPFVETAIRDLLYGRRGAPVVLGKRVTGAAPLFPQNGELTADTIADALVDHLTERGLPAARRSKSPAAMRLQLPLISRSPYFCSGCPHNSSTKVPDGSLVGAGIGCHGLVAIMDSDLVGDVTGLTQMGGEGAQWIGMSPFVKQKHLLQNLGDGTFHHSGSLAIRAAVAAGSNITYKVLYNSAVAMTGGQDPVGALTVAEMARSLLAEGVTRIIVTTEAPERHRRGSLPRGVDCWHRDRLEEAQRTLAGTSGVTVLIHDQECSTELRRKRKRGKAVQPAQRVMINERVCEGCGDCGVKSNCLSVQPVDTEFGRKTQIDQSTCNFDFSCLSGDCPAFMTVTPSRKNPPKKQAPPLDSAALPEPAVMPATSHTTRITGIGGTGVVTVSQVLATAATLAGRFVRTLDQTGLAQKGGAVVSDIKVFERPTPEANRAGEGVCDLYLGCDLLVAAEPRHLKAAAPGRTVAVISTSQVPTGRMVTDPDVTYPAISQVSAPIVEATDAERAVFLDARNLAVTLFGEGQYANMLLLGAACQAGRLPVRPEHVEDAIRHGGVKVEENLQAFRRGRQTVAAPADLDATVSGLRGKPMRRPVPEQYRAIAELVKTSPDSSLAQVVGVRVPELVAFQNAACARSYALFVERIRSAEATRVQGSEELAAAVARHLYKLMAYKDEYEVARLCLDREVESRTRAVFGADAQMVYRLHPPVLRALGMKKKIALGPWSRPVFRALAASRFLRGTFWDPFGHTEVRRLERELVVEYQDTVKAVAAVVNPETHARTVELANLPDIVRGYEEVKLRNVARYRERLSELSAELLAAPSTGVRLVGH